MRSFHNDDFFETVSSALRPDARHRRLRRAYIAAFAAVWLESVAAFPCFGAVYGSDAKLPTSIQTALLTNHGIVVYVTPAQKRLVDFLLHAMLVSIPPVMTGGLLLDRVAGVPLFDGSRRR